MKHTRHFPSDKKRIYEMLDWAMDQVRKCHFTPLTEQQINIALEEALVNIIHYAYPQKEGEIVISCYTPAERPGIVIKLQDRGIPFDPLAHAEKTRKYILSTDIEDMPLGGWGIHLMIGIMDEVEYIWEDNYNILTMTKYSKEGTKGT